MFEEFKSNSKAEWLMKVEKDLKGKPLESLDWEMFGHSFSPFYHHEDGMELPPLLDDKSDNTWEIGQNILVDNYLESNKIALELLNGGANALSFTLYQLTDAAELRSLLSNIQLEWISIQFWLKDHPIEAFIQLLHAEVLTAGFDPNKINCSFGYSTSVKQVPIELKQVFPSSRIVVKSPAPRPEIIEELVYCLKAGNEALSQFNRLAIEPVHWNSSLYFAISFSGNYFLDIAKIRALKNLWRQVLLAWSSELSNFPFIEGWVRTEDPEKDEHFNKIVATAQAMSAVIGGVNRLVIQPSDALKNQNGSKFSRRIALNIQHLLAEESHLSSVKDPSAGSYFLDYLTNYLAEQVWHQFQNSVE